jgi:hypothetical protein
MKRSASTCTPATEFCCCRTEWSRPAPSGELFGFERVHNLSNQSAFYIADAAKTFGQEDDITVLTVRRLAQAMAA